VIDVDTDLKELLSEKAEEMRLSPEIPPRVLGRARRHRFLNAAAAGGVVVGIALIGLVWVRAALEPSAHVAHPSPISSSPAPSDLAWPGIFPFDNRADAEAVQKAASEGHQPGLVDARVVVERFARERLGWATVYRQETLFDQKGLDGPLVIHISTCDATGGAACEDPDPQSAVVTVARLLEPAPFGIWEVTEVEGPSSFSPPAPQPLPSDPLSTFVGLTVDGRLVVVDSTNGTIYRVLVADALDVDPSSLARSFDGREVYFTRAADCPARIFRVPAEGGTPKEFASGLFPRPSPDGRLLAYVSASPDCGGSPELVVRDLATGQESRWKPRGLADQGICNPVWLPDGRTIAYEACGLQGDVYVLDTVGQPGLALDQGKRLGPGKEGWFLLGYDAADGGLVVRTRCVNEARPVCPNLTVGAFVIDPQSGSVIRQLSGFLDDAENEVLELHFDATGDHVLFLGFLDAVYRRDGTADPVKILAGLQAATW